MDNRLMKAMQSKFVFMYNFLVAATGLEPVDSVKRVRDMARTYR